jgi:hypothetical protein
MIDTNRGTVENTIPQLIHKLDDSDSFVRRAVVNGIVELAKNGMYIPTGHRIYLISDDREYPWGC